MNPDLVMQTRQMYRANYEAEYDEHKGAAKKKWWKPWASDFLANRDSPGRARPACAPDSVFRCDRSPCGGKF
jgi:hypothetical protein